MYRTLIRIDPARSQAPASIPDNNIVICITCHTSSKDRAMFSIPDQALFSSVTLIKLPPVCNYLVCWECHAMLLKIKKFRQTALKAQQMLNNNMRISPLSNLKSNNLVHWLSIAYQPRMEINPLVVKKAKIFPETFKEEVECETLKPEQQGVNCIEEDLIGISVKTETEVAVKTETEVPEESGTSHVDIVKCEVNRDCSSDDGLSDEETLLQPRKNNRTVLTPAERMRKYREKLKLNPKKLQEVKRKHALRNNKKISELTDEEREKMRKKWREQSRRRRKRKEN